MPMQKERIEETLAMAIRKVMPRVKEFGPQSRFREDLGADSLDMTSLIMEIEDEFHLLIEDDTARSVKSIQDAIDMISRALDPDSVPESAPDSVSDSENSEFVLDEVARA